MSKPVILTGLRANKDLHIGNYFGALLPLIDQVKKDSGDYQINLFVPDLHSITTPIEYEQLQQNIMNNLKIFAAAGLPLDNEDVKLYRQSYIPAHSEMTIILNNFTGMGEMGRMTQYKDKSQKIGGERVSVGLFDYPVMMAADILLYGAEYVPVGDDQTQHLEFTRDIAERINQKFGDTFTVPKPVEDQHKFFQKDQGLRIKDLTDPIKKMSKSDESDKGIIFLSDSPESAKKKIMSATTDSVNKVSFDPANQPGVSNLIHIYALIKGVSPEEAAKEFAGETQYGTFKQKVADCVGVFLSEFQAKLAKTSEQEITDKLLRSEQEMNKVAGETLSRLQKAVGLR
jgi:tryptophanyl-tRNA synthetase